MGIAHSTEKLDKYFTRLDKGKSQKIKPAHVEKVIQKLRNRETMLLAEIEEATKDSKKKRLKGKLKTAREQIERAEWLLKEIGDE
jgi:hypothetical protein